MGEINFSKDESLKKIALTVCCCFFPLDEFKYVWGSFKYDVHGHCSHWQ